MTTTNNVITPRIKLLVIMYPKTTALKVNSIEKGFFGQHFDLSMVQHARGTANCLTSKGAKSLKAIITNVSNTEEVRE